MREIILFDSDCMMCNHWMHAVLKRDQKHRFLFAALQSAYGQDFLSQRGLNCQDFNSLYLVQEGKAYYNKSTAVIKIISLLGPNYCWIYLAYLMPEFLRNMAYDLVAKHRKKLKKETCQMLSVQDRKKILD